MKLSELKYVNGKLLQEGDFYALGRPRDWQAHRLVSIGNESDLNLIQDDKNVVSVLASEALSKNLPKNIGIFVVDNPDAAFQKIHSMLASQKMFYPEDFENRINEKATIHKTAIISDRSVQIEKNCRIGPKVFIGPQTIVEEGTFIGPGTIIGTDPSGPPQANDGSYLARVGGVRIGRNAWIHANCVVERSIFGGFTEIGDYTYIDNLVSIGPGTRIGRACLLVAASVIGENSDIGDEVWVGPNSVIADGIKIGNKGSVTMGSVVIDNVPAGMKVTGNFAIDHKKFIEYMRRFS